VIRWLRAGVLSLVAALLVHLPSAQAQAPDVRAGLVDAFIMSVLEHPDTGEFTLILAGPPQRAVQGEVQITAFDQGLFEIRDMRYTQRFRVAVAIPAGERRLLRFTMPANRTGRPWVVAIETAADFRRTNPYMDLPPQ
jgi:hypothetical protein